MKGNIEAGWGRPSTTWVFGNKKHPDWFATQRACDLPGQLPASSHPHPPPPSATLKMFARREISFCKHKTRHGAMVWLKIGEIRSFFVGNIEKWMMVMRMFLLIALGSTINVYCQNRLFLIKLSERANLLLFPNESIYGDKIMQPTHGYFLVRCLLLLKIIYICHP